MTDKGTKSFQKAGNKLKKEVKTEKKAEEKEKALALADLKKMAKVGMKNVDPLDIKPPRVILVQGIKDKSELKDKSGVVCPDGQFFSDGANEIFEKMACYILYAAKGTHINKRHPDRGDLPKYDAIGMKPDGQLFTITFKNTGRNALSKLFTATKVQGLPMFAFQCSLETKLINGTDEQGQPLQWWIPVIRVGEVETDAKILAELIRLAKGLDEKTDMDLGEEKEEVETMTKDVENRNAPEDFEGEMEALQAK